MFYLAHGIPYLYSITLTSQWFFCLLGMLSPCPRMSLAYLWLKEPDIDVARQFSSWQFGTLQMSGVTTITSIIMRNFMAIMRVTKSPPGWLLTPLLYLPSTSPPGRLLGPSWLVFSLLLHPPLVFCFHLLVVLGYSVNAGVYKGTFRNRHIGSRILLPPSRKISSLVFQ